MVRIFLDAWEWDCCGTPFGPGDVVEFPVRAADERLRAAFAPLGATIDEVESHHEIDEPPSDRTRKGTVRRIVGVALDHTERREPRSPASTGAPVSQRADGDAVWTAGVDAGPSYTIVSTPVPGTAREVAVDRVPARARIGQEQPGLTPPTPPAEPVEGYLVDLDED